MNLLLVAIGGAFGSMARYLSSETITNLMKNSAFAKFPLGVFVVNVVGSFAAGALYYLVIKNFDNFDPKLKNFLFAGFLGGFTTFSAFSLDAFRLLTAGQYLQASAYIFSSVFLAILALFFGFYLMKLILV